MLSMQGISYSSVLTVKRNLRCSKMHSIKTVVDQKDDKTALNSFCFVFKNGIKFGVFKFRAISCLRVLNFVNFLKSEKSRNLILAKIRKNKVVTESLFVFSCDLS